MTRAGLRRPGHVDAQRTINLALQQVHLEGPALERPLLPSCHSATDESPPACMLPASSPPTNRVAASACALRFFCTSRPETASPCRRIEALEPSKVFPRSHNFGLHRPAFSVRCTPG